MSSYYLEIVSSEVDALTTQYERVHGLTIGAPDADLGQARVATGADRALVGIRRPLAAHAQPIVRMYFAVEDIQRAAKSAAMVAYAPTQQGRWGSLRS